MKNSSPQQNHNSRMKTVLMLNYDFDISLGLYVIFFFLKILMTNWMYGVRKVPLVNVIIITVPNVFDKIFWNGLKVYISKRMEASTECKLKLQPRK